MDEQGPVVTDLLIGIVGPYQLLLVAGGFLLASLLLLVGNIISDILVALVDPRVRFQ